MGILSVYTLHLGFPRLAIWIFSFWMITDLTDGDIARRCNLSTEKGATIDPLSDKLMYIPALAYMAWKGFLDPTAVMAFIALDVLGQMSRLMVENKAANLFGKAKTFLVVVLLIATVLEIIYGPLPHSRVLGPLMGFCIGLAFCSVAFKIIPNYWYANILSLMNMVCGIAGIVTILMGKPLIYAFGLVFLGQFLDLFDGRAAERWGSTPKGEMFDDIADGTSFGGTVGLMVAYSFKNPAYGWTLGILHTFCTIFRLVRFIIRKRKAGVEGGVEWFCGMPSPGGALLAGSACIFLEAEWMRAAMVVASSMLMISSIPYPHFGRSILPKVPLFARVLALGIFTIMLAHAVKRMDFSEPMAVVFAVSVVYMISPLFTRSSGQMTA
jgi:CDP-diacylglycerol--serine O-phosphatidyltransferase